MNMPSHTTARGTHTTGQGSVGWTISARLRSEALGWRAAPHDSKAARRKWAGPFSLSMFDPWIPGMARIERVPFYLDTHAVAKACDHDS